MMGAKSTYRELSASGSYKLFKRRLLWTQGRVVLEGSGNLLLAAPRQFKSFGGWVAARWYKFAPKLERAWCQIALAEEGFDLSATGLVDDVRGTDLGLSATHNASPQTRGRLMSWIGPRRTGEQ